MFDPSERAQIRAALQLWMEACTNSTNHPSEYPVCKAEFLVDNVLPLPVVRIEAIIAALETEVVYTTVPLAAAKYKVDAMKLRRQLKKDGLKPVPGSTVYRMNDVIFAVNTLKEKGGRRGFFR